MVCSKTGKLPTPTGEENSSACAAPINIVPNPTLTVAIPIKSSEILATNGVCPSVRDFAVPIHTSSLYSKAVPPFGEYVRLSPVLKVWLIRLIL